MTLAKAPPQIAARLDVSADAPVLELDRIIFAIDQQPVEWRLGYCRLGEGQSYRADMN